MKSDFLVAVTQLAAERNLPREIVLSAIEAALVSAYRKDSIAAGQNISVKLDPGSGDVSVYTIKTVAEEVEDPLIEISLEDARKIKPDAEIGETVPTGSLPHSAGRIAAQTAKQVVMQRLREAERELVFQEYEDKEGDVFSVTVQRVEPRQIIVDLGRAEAVLPSSEQSPYERYRTGQRMKVLLQTVERSSKGPELIVSRADSLLLRRLFEMEVPEIYSGSVEIEAIAREAGARSKVAVRAKQDGVDPVGSCVGLRGVRIQNIVNELHGEKIDVMEWDSDPATFIANALSPSQVLRVELNSDEGTAVAIVPDRQLSLAIGKEGQNARLAARLTGWKIDIRSNVEAEAAGGEAPKVTEAAAAVAVVEPEVVDEVVAEPVAEEAEPEVVEVEEPAVTEEEAPVVAEVEGTPAAELEVTEPEVPDVAEAEEKVAAEVEVPVAEVEPEAPAVEVAADEVPPEPIAIEIEEKEPEPVGAVVERSASLRDVSEDVWSLRRGARPEPEAGQIRFAEDIVGLRGGVTASRRGRQGNSQAGGGRRKRKAGGGGRRRR